MEPAGGPRPSSSSGPSAAGGAGLGTEQLNELTQASPPGTRTATQCRMICSLLQGHAFFKQIPEASVLALAQHITLRNFREHQVVFRQGSSGQAFYIILQGRCAEFRTGYANSPTPTYESMVGNNRTCNLEEYELQQQDPEAIMLQMRSKGPAYRSLKRSEVAKRVTAAGAKVPAAAS